ncbi:HAD family hydrolase [Leptospira selangorensis]|uniref:phosphoglycolate phosphatase n=1 Tax=Leptospira selangorensis TaxID=2484982 RepID=A0A4R9FP14_9LEPT|nr:HAD family hydrolase [Leptospira selangorensis]TGK00486.1 HAD family hydrolase [Leptospira selangorensis]TGM16989.1 HAD family hydrolase [Leptospira selangorensis]TGM21327.1 HAD family hydrolase [Leptospira selangorensis]
MDWNPKRVRALAFDVDGTLFSSEGIILETYAEAIRRFSVNSQIPLEVPDRERIMLEIGKPVKTIFLNLVPQLKESERDQISDSVLELLVSKIRQGEGEFYPKVKETVTSLKNKGYQILAASNGRMPYVKTILEVSGILPLFDPIVVLDNETIKTKPDIVAKYIRDYSYSPEEILMIGDRSSDHEAARKNGSPFAFCAYGHAPEGEIPDWEVSLAQLEDLDRIF